MANGGGSRVDELSSIPFGDLIHSVAAAIADGQFQLDKSSMRVAEFLGGNALLRDIDTGQLLAPDGAVSREPHSVDTRIYFGYTYDAATGKRQANLVSMMELGFVPTFYQFVDTVIELKIAVRLQRSSVSDSVTSAINDGGPSSVAPAKGRVRKGDRAVVRATPVDARYSSTYNYAADLTSKLKTKLVAVPPPLMLQDRIRTLVEQETAHREREAKERGLTQTLGGPAEDTACYRIKEAEPIQQRLVRAFTAEAWVAPHAFRERDGFVGIFLDDDSTPKGWLLGVFDRKLGFFLSTVAGSKGTVIKAADDYVPGKWHHIAGVYDGADMRLYVDGDLQTGSIEQSGAVAYPAKASFTIGGYVYPEGTVPLPGRIDEVRLWDEALDASHIKGDMNLRLKGIEPGLVGYWRFDKARGDAVPAAVAGADAMQRIAVTKVLASFKEPKGRLFGVRPRRCGALRSTSKIAALRWSSGRIGSRLKTRTMRSSSPRVVPLPACIAHSHVRTSSGSLSARKRSIRRSSMRKLPNGTTGRASTTTSNACGSCIGTVMRSSVTRRPTPTREAANW